MVDTSTEIKDDIENRDFQEKSLPFISGQKSL